VNPTFPFRWWDTLPSVITDFIFEELFYTFTAESDTYEALTFLGN
jgi:hypothetical protein